MVVHPLGKSNPMRHPLLSMPRGLPCSGGQHTANQLRFLSPPDSSCRSAKIKLPVKCPADIQGKAFLLQGAVKSLAEDSRALFPLKSNQSQGFGEELGGYFKKYGTQGGHEHSKMYRLPK